MRDAESRLVLQPPLHSWPEGLCAVALLFVRPAREPGLEVAVIYIVIDDCGGERERRERQRILHMTPGATMPHDPDAVAIYQSRRAQIVNRRFVPVHPHLRFIERMRRAARWRGADRSEEHTSELQSPMRNSYACFSLKNK